MFSKKDKTADAKVPSPAKQTTDQPATATPKEKKSFLTIGKNKKQPQVEQQPAQPQIAQAPQQETQLQIPGGQQTQQAPASPIPQVQISQGAATPAIGNQTMNNTPVAGGQQPTGNEQLAQAVQYDKKGRAKIPTVDYRYTIINSMGKKETGTFEAESENDVRNFLLSQDYQVLEIKPRSKFDIDIGNDAKIGAQDLSFTLTQLSTYIRAGIPLADSIRILAKQTRKPGLKKSFNQLVYQLLKGESLSDAMDMQGNVYPKLLINMVKTSEMTGDLPSILDDMSEYYTSMDATRKQMKAAMTYPIVVLTLAFGVLIFMLTYLVPQFSAMFEENNAEMPALTQAILNISQFIKEKWYFVLGGVLLVGFTFSQLFKKVQKFKEKVQVILMHFPVAKNIIIYNEIANFTKTFASLLNHGVFITDSMEILSKITSNEIYKKIINKCLENLAKGDTVSSAFKGEWAIPVVAYEMIVTGETTGQLGAMMDKVATHFQGLHKNVIDQMKSLVEPILICFLAVVVGVILISIIQPMFSIYSQVQ